MSHTSTVRHAVSDANLSQLAEAVHRILDLTEKLRIDGTGQPSITGAAIANQILVTVGPPLGVPLRFAEYGVITAAPEES